MVIEINKVKVTISYVGNDDINLNGAVLIGVWGGVKMLSLLDEIGKTSNVILVPWNKDRKMHPDKDPEDLWIEHNRAIELPLELLNLE